MCDLASIFGFLFDLIQVSINLADVTTDFLILIDWSQQAEDSTTRKVFFPLMTTILVLACIISAVALVIRLEDKLPSAYFNDGKWYSWLAWIVIFLPISPFAGLIGYLVTKIWPDLDDFGNEKVDWALAARAFNKPSGDDDEDNERKPSTQETDGSKLPPPRKSNNNSSNKNDGSGPGGASKDVFAGIKGDQAALAAVDAAVIKRISSYILLGLNAVAESIPSAVVQLIQISLSAQGDVSTLSIVSLLLSLSSVAMKSFVAARSFSVGPFFFKTFAVAFDVFSLGFVFVSLFSQSVTEEEGGRDVGLFGTTFLVTKLTYAWIIIKLCCIGMCVLAYMLLMIRVACEAYNCEEKVGRPLLMFLGGCLGVIPAAVVQEALKLSWLIPLIASFEPTNSLFPAASFLHAFMHGGSGSTLVQSTDWAASLRAMLKAGEDLREKVVEDVTGKKKNGNNDKNSKKNKTKTNTKRGRSGKDDDDDSGSDKGDADVNILEGLLRAADNNAGNNDDDDDDNKAVGCGDVGVDDDDDDDDDDNIPIPLPSSHKRPRHHPLSHMHQRFGLPLPGGGGGGGGGGGPGDDNWVIGPGRRPRAWHEYLPMYQQPASTEDSVRITDDFVGRGVFLQQLDAFRAVAQALENLTHDAHDLRYRRAPSRRLAGLTRIQQLIAQLQQQATTYLRPFGGGGNLTNNRAKYMCLHPNAANFTTRSDLLGVDLSNFCENLCEKLKDLCCDCNRDCCCCDCREENLEVAAAILMAVSCTVSSILGFVFPIAQAALYFYAIRASLIALICWCAAMAALFLFFLFVPSVWRYLLTCRLMQAPFGAVNLVHEYATYIDSYFSLPLRLAAESVDAPSVPEDAFLLHVLPFLTTRHVKLHGLRLTEFSSMMAVLASSSKKKGNNNINNDNGNAADNEKKEDDAGHVAVWVGARVQEEQISGVNNCAAADSGPGTGGASNNNTDSDAELNNAQLVSQNSL